MRLPPEDQMMTEVRGACNTRPSAGRNGVARADQLDPSGCTRSGVSLRPVEVTGGPGALFLDGQQRLIGVCAVDIAGGEITSVNSIVNPAPRASRRPEIATAGLRDDGLCEPLSPRSRLVEVLAPRVAFSAGLVVRLGVERRIAPAVDLSGGGELSAIDIATRSP
jgi:hypothetical protein